MKILSKLFCILFLVSCSPTASPINEQSNTTESPSITTSPVIPTNTPLLNPTSVPTPQSAPTAINIPTEYKLPNWISDSESTIGMMISDVAGDIYKLSFLNLATRDSFEISISTDLVRGYFWTPDGTQFGFLSPDTQTAFLVNLKNGKVEQSLISEKAVQFLKDERKKSIEPLVINGTFPDDFSFLPLYHSEYSANLNYVARLDYQIAGSPPVVIENLETGQITQITYPPDELFTYGFSWSPTISQLAILRGTSVEGMMRPSGDRIEIHKPNGEKVATFEVNFQSPVWSPDGNKILYRETSSISPCILDINTATKKCIREIERKHPNVSSIAGLGWSINEKQIYYLYYGNDESGLCIYDLIDGKDFCPTNGLLQIQGYNVERYIISPDEHFFIFQFGISCAGCDFWSDPAVGIIGTDGVGFYTIGNESLVSTSFTFSYPMGTLLWRPKLTLSP